MATPHVAFEIPVLRVGVWPASVAMSAETVPGVPDWQFSVVDVADPSGFSGVDNYAGACIGPASSGYPAIGVLQDNPKINQAADVWLSGITKAQIGATVTVGQLLMSNGASPAKMIVATSTNYAIAKALSPGSSGDIIAVYLHNFGKI